MDIVKLNSSNFIGLSAKYTLDKKIKFNENLMFTEQDITVPINEAFKDINDSKINNYSNLFLTKNDFIVSGIKVEPLNRMDDEGFSTFFAANAPGTITPSTKFWVVEEPPIGTFTANLAVSGEIAEIKNNYFFDVEFLTEKLCKISHENENIIRYLTVDYTGNLSFCKDLNLDIMGEYSPQQFYYIYDREFNFVVFLKNVNDIPLYVTFNANNNELVLTSPLTGTTVPYSISSIFRIARRSESPNATKIYDPWLSYRKDLYTNSQYVNPTRSFNNIKSNLLINNEYFNTNNNELNVNVMSLKNSSTPENFQSRGNPFFNEQSVEFRNYTSLFTGSNQEKGNDNITINYESYTTNILFKKDKVTYFHIPQVFYPFERLNINDSNLINSGAIAGDHPIKSDKVFKKKADYKYSSTYGDSKDETTGEFLCSWLSGNTDVNSRPRWVDRYYNPKKISFISALTASDYKAIKYISLFDCLIDKVKDLIGDVDVFDKPSDLIFEKGTYYAYYHFGPKDVDKFINTFSRNLIQKDLLNYKYFNGSDVNFGEPASEYTFNGETYATTSSLSSIQASNQFTLVFDAYSSDWTSPLGYQLVGNFDRDGFGIFNKNTVTPTLYFNSSSALYVTNTDFKILNVLELPSNISGIVRLQGLTDTFLILNDNSVRRYNLTYSETRRTDYNRNIGDLYDLDYTEDYAYALYNNFSSTEIALINLRSNEVLDITSNPLYIKNNFNSQSRTINFYNNELYCTDGLKAERVASKLYYLKNNEIRYRDLDNSSSPVLTAFKSSTTIEDFSFDFENNIWILFNNNHYAKYTSNREFILSGAFNDSYKNYKIDFISEFNNNSYEKYVVFIRQSQTENKKLKIYKLSSNSNNFTETLFNSNTAKGLCISNTEFLRSFIGEKYPSANLNVKALLTNNFNLNDTVSPEIIFNLSSLDAGYHNFAVRFDAYEGYMFLYVDGQQQGIVQFDPRKYIINNISERPFLFGSSSYLNSVPLFNYLQNKSYLVNDLKIKNLFLYNKPLYTYDIFFHTRKGMKIRDINFDIACGKRNYLEEIERYFKLNTPSSKSTLFNLVIRNTGIKDINLQRELEKRILEILANTAPAYTKLNSIKWSN